MSFERFTIRIFAPAALVLAAACTDRVPTDSAVPAGREVRSQIVCTVLVADRAMRCGEPGPTGAGAQDVILGGQGTYVRLESDSVGYDSVAGAFSVDVSVQNLLAQQMGTPDGVTATGVKVFFEQLPVATEGTGAVTIANADGTGNFTRIGQPFFAYPEILEARGTSRPHTWRFDVPASVLRFSFVVYVHTVLPLEQGALRWRQEFGLASYCCEIFYDGVWGASPNHVYSVAFQQVLQYDGEAWIPVLDAGAYMWDVWGTSRYDVFVAGDSGKVWHHDGNQWTVKRQGTVPHQISGLWSAGDDVFAVGRYREPSADVHGLILHSADGGSTWSEALSPVDGRRYFRDVFRSGSDVYIVGYDEPTAGGRWGVIHRSRDEGATWSDTTITGGERTAFYAVLVDGGDLWVAGERRIGGTDHGLLLHSTDSGATWSEVALPSSARTLHSLWKVPGGMLYALGGGGLYRFNGDAWTDMELTLSGGWRGVWGSSDEDIHIVGTGNNLARHWDGSSWRHIPASRGFTNDLNAVAAAEEMGVAVGSDISVVNGSSVPRGVILFDLWGYGSWERRTEAQDSSIFEDVWLADRSFGIAVGSRQVAGERQGMVWTLASNGNWGEATPTAILNTPLDAVWGTDSENAYAFGVRSVPGGGASLIVHHFRGPSFGWSETTIPYPGTRTPVITEAWGNSADAIYVVGYAATPSGSWTGVDAESFVMRWNGTSWSVDVGPADQRRLTGVWSSGESVFLSGHTPTSTSGRWAGFVRRSNDGGATWTETPLSAPTGDGRVNGIYGTSLGTIYAAGSRGIVYQWDGYEWSTILGADRPAILGMGGYGRDVLAVGGLGLILRGTR